MKKVNLPSGAVLEIQLAPFGDANKLNKAIAKELKTLSLDSEMNLSDPVFLKDLVCTALSSDGIESCLWACFKRCTYNNEKISQDTFEKEESRQDYFIVCREVLQEQIGPFVKSLLPMWKDGNPSSKKEA